MPIQPSHIDTEAEGGPDPRRAATVDARIYPRGGLDVLSRDEVARLRDASAGGMHDLTLSPRPARERFYAEISRWSVAYA